VATFEFQWSFKAAENGAQNISALKRLENSGVATRQEGWSYHPDLKDRAKLKSSLRDDRSPLAKPGLTMKAKVYVTLKPSVLDPQGKAIHHSVELMGYGGIRDVRQGKYFEIALEDTLDEARAREEAERVARDVLSNPVIEDYRVEIER
jgi:phosphoribosylformylglycinamidine synthase